MTKSKYLAIAAAGGALMIGLLPSAAPAADTEMIAQGKALFEENCQICHQADAIGEPGIAPSLTNPELQSIATDTYFETTIRDGRAGTAMMPFDFLGRRDVRAIVAFLRSHETLPNRAEEVAAQPDSHGDPRLGKQWFEDICSTCHGVDGNGYDAGGTGTAIGYPGFLDKASDGFIRETIKSGRSNTRMLGFSTSTGLANLSDREIDDVIAYMRTLRDQNADVLE